MSGLESAVEHLRALVSDGLVVLLVADVTPDEADAAARLLRDGDVRGLKSSDRVVAVLPLQQPLHTAAPKEHEQAVEDDPVYEDAPVLAEGNARAEVPKRRLITGPPPAQSSSRASQPLADIGAAAAAIEQTPTVEQTLTVEQTQTAEMAQTAEPKQHDDGHALDETVGSVSDLDPLDADTLTAAGESPIVARPFATAPKVLTVLCAAGHVVRIGVADCGVCGAAIEPGSEAVRDRPEFVAAALQGRERILLGRGAVFGRRPRSSRMQGVRVPHLVTLPSPNEDISRSHLEIRLEDWSVLAVDLGSTNGTMLLREGRAPLRLRAGVATNVDFGDQLDVGEGVIITLEEL